MKKAIITGLITSAVLGLAGTAFADAATTPDPLQISGSFKYETRVNHDNAFNSKSTANNFYEGINLNWKANDSTSFFGRVAGEQKAGQSTPNSTDDFKLDQYGVKSTYSGWTFSLGRQGTQLGQGGTFYAGQDIGPLTYFDGIVVTTKFDNVNFKLIGGKVTAVNDTAGLDYTPAQNWYGAELNQDFTKDINFGVTFAKRKNLTDSNAVVPSLGTNYWSAFTTIKGGAVTWNGEYVKSNANTASAAYDLNGTYAFDNKNSLTVGYNHVQANAVDFDNSGIGGVYYPNGVGFVNGYKGETYSYHHDFNKTVGMTVYYLDLKPMNGSGTDGEFAANVKWSF
jgi:hypothetical protein